MENKKSRKSWFEYMRLHKPMITEHEAAYILWNHTCFPFDDATTIKQIDEYFKKQLTNGK